VVLDSVDLGGHSALQVAAGKSHTCAILDNGALKCWGSNSAGQLGLGDLQNRGDSGGKLSADTTVDLVF
jgi:alpha-tubulin suppressor-like RCC1 family protein